MNFKVVPVHFRRQILAVLTILTVESLNDAYAYGQEALEYQLKAAFLFNFAKFTEWPQKAFEENDSPLVLGVLGEDPFGEAIEPIKGKVVKRRKLEVKRFKDLVDLQPCHILFISASEKERLAEILTKVEGSAVLTVGDLDQFIDAGGVIRFTILDEKVGFEINAEAIKKAEFKISTQLLKFSKLVTPEAKTGGN
ncbi:YfiR family protein [bacterium]|nr:YfiR family protein [bacterium]